MDIRKKEIRRIISGFSVFDGEKTVAAGIFNTDIQGAFSGSFTSRFLGLTTVKRQYKFNVEQPEAREMCKKAFSDMGRRVELVTAPDAAAVVYYPHLHNPFVLTADFEGRQLLLQYYTARTIPSVLFGRLYLSKWEKLIPPDVFERTEMVTVKPQLVVPEPEEKDDGKKDKKENDVSESTDIE